MNINLFDLTLKLNKFPIQKAREHLTLLQTLNREGILKNIEISKQAILDHHIKTNHFYQSFLQNSARYEWSSIPVMTKRDLQIPLKQRISSDYTLENLYVNKTSGSSGDPFIFAKDRFCHAMTWAVIQDRFSWHGLDFNSSKQARFYGIPLDFKGYYKERVKDAFSHRFRFSVFDLSDKAFEECLDKFSKTDFKYINGYTSPIVQFAKYLKRKNIILKALCTSLEYCIVTSEMLFEDDKKLMESQFGVPIIKEYGASELDLIAFENQQSEWIINNETLYVEILDKNDAIQENGKEGRIVITSLFNKAHPFIRYDIGDIGIIDEKSPVDKPILKKLIGRTNDLAILPSGKTAAGLTFYYITKQIIEEDGNVKEFVIEQITKKAFNVEYVSIEELSLTKKSIIKSEMQRYLEPGLEIEFVRKDKINRSRSGKLKQFTSRIKT